VQAEVLGALLDHIRRQVRHLLYLCGSQDRSYFWWCYRRIRFRRCLGTPTRPGRNTCGSCSYRPKSSASSSSCALISVRGCTRHLPPLISTSRLG
jgi:hypothetical protein